MAERITFNGMVFFFEAGCLCYFLCYFAGDLKGLILRNISEGFQRINIEYLAGIWLIQVFVNEY
jgi:hypothetical protein